MAKETRTRNTVATVGVSSSKVAEECYQERVFHSYVNNSTGGQKIYLAFGQEAVVGSGMPLSVGGFWSESKDSGENISQEQVNAISDIAGASLAIVERIKMEVR